MRSPFFLSLAVALVCAVALVALWPRPEPPPADPYAEADAALEALLERPVSLHLYQAKLIDVLARLAGEHNFSYAFEFDEAAREYYRQCVIGQYDVQQAPLRFVLKTLLAHVDSRTCVTVHRAKVVFHIGQRAASYPQGAAFVPVSSHFEKVPAELLELAQGNGADGPAFADEISDHHWQLPGGTLMQGPGRVARRVQDWLDCVDRLANHAHSLEPAWVDAHYAEPLAALGKRLSEPVAPYVTTNELTPTAAVLRHLATASGIDIVAPGLVHKNYVATGVHAPTVTLPLAEALDFVLQQEDGRWSVAPGLVCVAFSHEPSPVLLDRVYPVADILAAAGDPAGEQLREVLSEAVAPDTWIDAGGYAALVPWGRFLCVRQGFREHLALEQFLQRLRQHQRGEPVEVAAGPLAAKLTQKVKVPLQRWKLSELAEHLTREYGLPTLIDSRQRRYSAVDPNLEVSLENSSASLGEALLQGLAEAELGYRQLSGALLITELESECRPEQLRIYSLAHLQSGLATAPCSGEELADAVFRLIATDGWQDVGGPNSLTTYGNLLLVTAPMEVQQATAAFLQTLSEVASAEDSLEPRTVPVMGEAMDEPLAELLQRPVSLERSLFRPAAAGPANEPAGNTPQPDPLPALTLNMVVAELSRQLEAPIALDEKSLDEYGRSTAEVLNPASIHNVPAAMAVRELLPEREFELVPRRGQLTVIAYATAVQEGPLRLYPVGDLQRALAEEPASGSRGNTLIDALETCIHPESWAAVGGYAECIPLGNVLCVRQSPAAHGEIEQLLADLRRGVAQRPGNGAANGTATTTPANLPGERRLALELPPASGFQALRQLAAAAQVGLVIDSEALEKLPTQGIVLKIENESVDEVLRRLCEEWQLDWTWHENVLRICDSAAANVTVARVYLLPEAWRQADDRLVIEPMHDLVAAETWDVVGGLGDALPLGEALVVAQTGRVHCQVRSLVESLRLHAHQLKLVELRPPPPKDRFPERMGLGFDAAQSFELLDALQGERDPWWFAFIVFHVTRERISGTNLAERIARQLPELALENEPALARYLLLTMVGAEPDSPAVFSAAAAALARQGKGISPDWIEQELLPQFVELPEWLPQRLCQPSAAERALALQLLADHASEDVVPEALHSLVLHADSAVAADIARRDPSGLLTAWYLKRLQTSADEAERTLAEQVRQRLTEFRLALPDSPGPPSPVPGA